MGVYLIEYTVTKKAPEGFFKINLFVRNPLIDSV